MAVAKWKLEVDMKIRRAGGKVVRGRVYNGRGDFWGPRLDFTMLSREIQEACLKAFAKQAGEWNV